MIDRSRVRWIFLDAVGTILFPEPSPATVYTNMAKEFGAEIDKQVVRQRLLQAFQKQEQLDEANLWKVSEERERQRWQTIVAETLSEVEPLPDCFEALWNHFSETTAWQLHPELSEVLTEGAKRGIRFGVASNFDGRLRSILAGFPIVDSIQNHVVVSSLLGWRKPASHFFAEVIRQTDVQPDQILFVGDDLRNDYHGATASGLQAVLLSANKPEDPSISTIQTLRELLG